MTCDEGDDGTRLSDVLETVQDLERANLTTIEDVLQRLGAASFMVLLLIVALLIMTPLSGIPGVSSAGGLIIALIALQLAIGRRTLWLPRWIRNLTLPEERMHTALKRLETPLKRLEGCTRERLALFASGPMTQVLLAVCGVAGALMPFLELVPLTSSLLAGVIALLTIAMLSRDGLFALAGLVAMSALAWSVTAILFQTISVV